MSNDTSQARFTVIAAVLFGLIFLLIAWDLVEDFSVGTGGVHVTIESIVLLLAASGTATLLRQGYAARASILALQRDLEQVRRDSKRWRQESRTLIEGLALAIQHQFAEWKLTAAESEIALLLLKGLSLKEIAALRETSERTVREQARSVYRKSGISGRSALSAFFLEDLLLPPTTGTP
jgi:DNA-binding CsgD family transcriptional regulator